MLSKDQCRILLCAYPGGSRAPRPLPPWRQPGVAKDPGKCRGGGGVFALQALAWPSGDRKLGRRGLSLTTAAQTQSGRKSCQALSTGAFLVILLNRKPGSAGTARWSRERWTLSPRAPTGTSGGEGRPEVPGQAVGRRAGVEVGEGAVTRSPSYPVRDTALRWASLRWESRAEFFQARPGYTGKGPGGGGGLGAAGLQSGWKGSQWVIQDANNLPANRNAHTRQPAPTRHSQSRAREGRRDSGTANPQGRRGEGKGGHGAGAAPPFLGSASNQPAPLQTQPFWLPAPAFCSGPRPNAQQGPQQRHSGSSSPRPDTAALGIGDSTPERPCPYLLPLPAPIPRSLSGLAPGSPAQGDGRGLTCRLRPPGPGAP
ncbi:collagen alpha-1(I) chain-like [Trachypithecus francoisi]|uniref:collagen alpha-1(I) chain-like n=1 Tax=Trachypithecus francoisi TaxID=54180 RepID=UPI00141AF5C8|nr:collagen alpha-1(I) chain-like [Trachypithecus francoisi]